MSLRVRLPEGRPPPRERTVDITELPNVLESKRRRWKLSVEKHGRVVVTPRERGRLLARAREWHRIAPVTEIVLVVCGVPVEPQRG